MGISGMTFGTIDDVSSDVEIRMLYTRFLVLRNHIDSETAEMQQIINRLNEIGELKKKEEES